MKKYRKSRIGKLASNMFNIRYWSDYDRTKSLSHYLWHASKNLFVAKQSAQTESFEQAVTRMNLTEESLVARQHALLRLTIIMFVVGSFLLAYSVFQLLYGTYNAMGVSLVVTMIAWVLAFRYHFWYFQIKIRRLGCTFKQWYHYSFKGEKQ